MRKQAHNFVDLTGKKFTDWTVISLDEPKTKEKRESYWVCKCKCGTIKTLLGGNLRSGKSTSCGCSRIEMIQGYKLSEHPLYWVYKSIQNRCYRKTDKSYHNYGGRGIKMSKSWYNSFNQFVVDMGQKPTPSHSIERLDNEKGYSKNNCKWGTPKEQGNNQRTNVILEYKGKKMNVTQWAEYLEIKRHLIYSRLKLGWSIERILGEY